MITDFSNFIIITKNGLTKSVDPNTKFIRKKGYVYDAVNRLLKVLCFVHTIKVNRKGITRKHALKIS